MLREPTMSPGIVKAMTCRPPFWGNLRNACLTRDYLGSAILSAISRDEAMVVSIWST
jgi:hypothetical protein